MRDHRCLAAACGVCVCPSSRSKIDPESVGGVEVPATFGLHVNVMAIGETAPGLQLPRISDAAAGRLGHLNSFLHSLLGHGLWTDRSGLITCLPGENKRTRKWSSEVEPLRRAFLRVV